MSLNSNFNSQVPLAAGVLTVEGASGALDGATLVSRHVALKQGAQLVHGPANSAPGQPIWAAEPPLPAAGMQAGDALAIGTETYLVTDHSAFVTVTWAATIKIAASAPQG